MHKLKLILPFLFIFLTGCGSYYPKYLNEEDKNIHVNPYESEVEKRFYLIGDAGLGAYENETLKAFESFVEGKDTKDDYVIYLGDNIYPSGLPKKDEKGRASAEEQLDAQINVNRFFDGKILFIPGNHDWYSDGLKGLKRQEEYVEDKLDDNEAFQPENGCAIEEIDVSEEITMLVLDTEWYIENWDKHPTINDECDIKTREDFMLEIEGELKKNNEKTIIIAMHHPAFTYGLHGGYFNLNKHIYAADNNIPLPIFASLVTLLRSQGGVSPQDRYNNRYNELMKRLVTMARDNDRVVFVSGHEHVLQYIENKDIKQIVSGSGSKDAPVAIGKGSLFAYGGKGFAVLEVLKDGSSNVHYYKAEDGKPERMFSKVVHEAPKEFNVDTLPTKFPKTILASVYPKENTEKSKSYEWFWGDHYRKSYGTQIEVPVGILDSLRGGMTVQRKGGGHQTRSLRLMDAEGRTFNLRALEKSAVQFLQTTAFRDTYVEEDFDETLTEDIIKDFYTSSHPYGAYVIPKLSDAVGVYHTNPKLYYVPKQKALGKYNLEYGDELYMLVERPDETFLDQLNFGKPDAIESTSDVLENMRDDEKYRIDEEAFVRARLFDMLIGDWDRHQDQWRWSRFDDEQRDIKMYRPIPRDRDQVFANYDGALLNILNVLMPATQQFQQYDGELKDIKWINLAGIKIDRTFAQTSDREVWLSQASIIQELLTDEVIEEAFKSLPGALDPTTAEVIKSKLRERRSYLVNIAQRYYDYLNDLVIITATDKDDQVKVDINRDHTIVSISRIKDGAVQPPFKRRVIPHKETKEIWVYALDDDDEIVVSGKGRKVPRIRIIGGQNNDIYNVEGGRRVKVYDHKSKPNTIVSEGNARFIFKDNYKYNNYRYNKFINESSTILPSIGFNPDDGMLVGLSYAKAKKGFSDDPFGSRHSFNGGYFFATDGFTLQYNGEFANVFDYWKFLVGGKWTSENFTQNFFGFGNETENNDDELGLDYNRVKTGGQKVYVGVVKNGHYGSKLSLRGIFESVEVQETQGRFINEFFNSVSYLENRKNFTGLQVDYSYAGYDNKVNPTRGMFFKANAGVTSNIENFDRTFGTLESSLEFFNAITRNRKWVLNTQIRGAVNIGDNYEFYQAVSLGTNSGLRGFRQERFSGESSLAFKGDLRYHLTKFKTGLLPLELGVFVGGDVGRVWQDGDASEKWHNDYGGGFWLTAVDSISGEFRLFNSVEGLLFSFGFGLAF